LTGTHATPRWPRFIAQESTGPRAFFVMEYLIGQSLQQWLARLEASDAHIPHGIVSFVLCEAALGLHALHELRHKVGAPLGAVHRDVSPHNIFIEESGAVRVIDLGVAKSRVRRSEQTEEGVLRGHLRYMAPEQAQGAPPHRTMDVWGLGATLFASVTRQVPYAGVRDVHIMSLMNDPYPILMGFGGAEDPNDEALFRVIRPATARAPSDRYPTAEKFAEALHAAHAPSQQERVARFAGELSERTSAIDAEALRFVGAVVSDRRA
jgi:eukaryotic-like serine/threonine-protein kinase